MRAWISRKANTEVTDSEVTVTLPAVEIFDISIDNDSIQYYDEKAALLNWERKEDAMDAIASAKEDVEQQTQEMEDLETMAQGAGENADYRNAV